MSEYPCTGIDKAILKFALQDRKISQIVSVNISAFFPSFARQLLPLFCFFDTLAGRPVGVGRQDQRLPYETYAIPCGVILTEKPT
jgi:hypothetical protein